MNKFTLTHQWPSGQTKSVGQGKIVGKNLVCSLRQEEKHHLEDDNDDDDLRRICQSDHCRARSVFSVLKYKSSIALWTEMVPTIGIVIFLLSFQIDHKNQTLQDNNLEWRHTHLRYIFDSAPIAESIENNGNISDSRSSSSRRSSYSSVNILTNTSPEVHHQWTKPAIESTNAISGVFYAIATTAGIATTIGNLLLFLYCNTESRIFFSFNEKCAILPLRFSLGIFILMLVQAPPAVHSLGKR